jgi:hypothetical protein
MTAGVFNVITARFFQTKTAMKTSRKKSFAAAKAPERS